MAHNVTLGQIVTYVSTKGHQKLAFVIGTSDTLTAGTTFAEQFPLSEDQVHLMVFGPTGSHSPQYQVPTQDSVSEVPDFADGGYFYVPAVITE